MPMQVATAGPLPLNELVGRRDGWLLAGWKARDAW